MKRLLDDIINGSTPMLYHLVMMGFIAALALALPVAVRFMARQFLFCWFRTAKAERKRMSGAEREGIPNADSTNQRTLKNVPEGEENEPLSPLGPDVHRNFPEDPSFAGRQNSQSGLHPGGKTFSLLRSKNPICETASWIAIL
jgi:hypothetical protein